MIKKLSSLANELDAAGEYAAADRIDSIIESLTKSAGNPDQRHPDWVAAVSEALKHFDTGMQIIISKQITIPAELYAMISELRRLVNVNKPR
jgi:hypothetical protein